MVKPEWYSNTYFVLFDSNRKYGIVKLICRSYFTHKILGIHSKFYDEEFQLLSESRKFDVEGKDPRWRAVQDIYRKMGAVSYFCLQ